MATTESAQPDPLLLLRQSVASGSPCIPTTTEDATSATTDDNLAQANFLQFTSPTQLSIALHTATRFISNGKPVNLRSIYLAWLKREATITEYNASTSALNTDLGAGAQDPAFVVQLSFVERLNLITWLEGASEETEHIRPLKEDSLAAAASAQVAAGTRGGIAPITSGLPGAGKTIDPRLQEIYNGERKMGDRNSVLRGIKPTDFSHVRKLAAPFNARKAAQAAAAAAASATTTLAHNPKAPPNRRPDPIIMLSPSASSLLRMSNIKSFLENGIYVPPDSSSMPSVSNALLNTSRLIPSVDPNRPIRFVVVDTPERFKPEYWSRVVAVFTTGQAWQFKSYKWQKPQDLFRNTLGVYVGFKGDVVPDTIKGWGRGVSAVSIDKWNPGQGPAGRWRDREVVEGIWKGIEENMRSKGWRKESGPVGA